MKRPSLLVASLASLVLVAASPAAVSVGDKPSLKFRSATDNADVDLAKLSGKLVVVDFWATWCGPCMAEAGHMVSIKDKYADKGLQMIGISLDQDKAKMIEVAKSSGFAWPQYFDGLVWKNRLAQSWGVDSIPRTFLISTDGAVLWTGHSARLDAELERAFKEHPPHLTDPKLAEEYTSLLDQVDAKLAASEPDAALKLYAKIPASAKQDADLAPRIEKAHGAIETYAANALADVDKLVADKKYLDAITKLRDLSAALAGSPLATDAKAKLAKLMSDPAARDAVAEMARLARADEALASADKLRAAGRDPAAYAAYQQLARSFPKTPAAETAAQAVAAYDADPAMKDKLKSAAASPDAKAKSALSLADNYARAGKPDLAKQKYQLVIDQFPDTPSAQSARKALDSLK